MNLYGILLPMVFIGASVFFVAVATAKTNRLINIETRQLLMEIAKTMALLAIALAIIMK